MKIARIRVSRLFGRFDHDLKLNPDERVAIMIGPNGFGKTTILRLTNALFQQRTSMTPLYRTPYDRIVVDFDDGSALAVNRVIVGNEDERVTVSIEYEGPDGQHYTYTPERFDAQRVDFPLSLVEEWTGLDRVGSDMWRDGRGELLSLEEVVARYEDQLPISSERSARTPEWLREIRSSISVRLIDTERLNSGAPVERRTVRGVRSAPTGLPGRAVRRFSQDLAERIQRKLTEYGTLSQSLDRTFPARLVEQPSSPERDMDVLRQDLARIESKRAKLQKAGLLGVEPDTWRVGTPMLERADDSRRAVLEVFARDSEEKLSVFDDLYRRVDAFRRIANARLLYKNVTVGQDGIHVTTPEGEQLELEMLSSGEQHQLVLLYELLFRVPANSFILVDEPELSLHVAWQAKFLQDLDEMAELSQFRVLLATHSPQIIGDRWDLTVELKGPRLE